ncbi:HGxxPAAW family protein [Ruania albidiflava]|uniref:HGxxPAAW family protein n=1 Tax=Ruania albidiflava TaxID=366586 RepID=UPI0003B49705|nr:HGxxPAAW family protein [Ruania albidiflava]
MTRSKQLVEGKISMTDVNTHDEGSVAARPDVAETLPVGPPPANHGRTGAGWTLFVGGAIAALLVGAGMIVPSMTLVYTGIAVAVVGIVASIVLRAAGYGQVERVRARE